MFFGSALTNYGVLPFLEYHASALVSNVVYCSDVSTDGVRPPWVP